MPPLHPSDLAGRIRWIRRDLQAHNGMLEVIDSLLERLQRLLDIAESAEAETDAEARTKARADDGQEPSLGMDSEGEVTEVEPPKQGRSDSPARHPRRPRPVRRRARRNPRGESGRQVDRP